jgi:hypothetical protein
MTSEDDWNSVIAPRLIAANADLHLVHALYVDRDRVRTGLVLPNDAALLAEAFASTGAALAVIDPLLGHIGLHLDTHKDQHIRQVTNELDRVAQDHSASVLGIVHLNKTTEMTDLLYRVMASQALTAAARSVLGVFKDQADPKTGRLLVHIKSNWSAFADTLGFEIVAAPEIPNADGPPIQTSQLRWTGERPDLDRFNVLAAAASGFSPEMSEVFAIVAEHGPITPAAAHGHRKNAAGLAQAGTRGILGKLRERGLVVSDKQHRYSVREPPSPPDDTLFAGAE